MQAAVAMQMAISAKEMTMPQTAKKDAWAKARQQRGDPKNELCNARYKRWCGARLPPMNSRASRWYRSKRPCCGLREHCAIEYVQY